MVSNNKNNIRLEILHLLVLFYCNNAGPPKTMDKNIKWILKKYKIKQKYNKEISMKP